MSISHLFRKLWTLQSNFSGHIGITCITTYRCIEKNQRQISFHPKNYTHMISFRITVFSLYSAICFRILNIWLFKPQNSFKHCIKCWKTLLRQLFCIFFTCYYNSLGCISIFTMNKFVQVKKLQNDKACMLRFSNYK